MKTRGGEVRNGSTSDSTGRHRERHNQKVKVKVKVKVKTTVSSASGLQRRAPRGIRPGTASSHPSEEQLSAQAETMARAVAEQRVEPAISAHP
jgi:hypothetical protein